MLKDTDYVLAHSHETFDNGRPMGVRIFVAAGRPVTEQEERAAWNIGEQMFKEIWKANVKQDEKMGERAAKDREDILKLFEGKNIFVEEIPNGYCNDPCCSRLPWFIVTTPIGHIKIGWRKRVILIDWTKTLQKQNAEELFPNEDVTKSGKYEEISYIHAWSYEKAKEYLEKIHSC